MSERTVTHNFIARLERLAGQNAGPDADVDRQALASLRRTFTTWPVLPAEAIRIVAPFVPRGLNEERENIYYLIAALFALHPESAAYGTGYGHSLGGALAAARRADTSAGKGAAAERALLGLLRCRLEDMPNHLRHTMSYLRAREIPVDYRRLMSDLEWWESEKATVQRRWARDFWAQESGANSTSSNEETQDVH